MKKIKQFYFVIFALLLLFVGLSYFADYFEKNNITELKTITEPTKLKSIKADLKYDTEEENTINIYQNTNMSVVNITTYTTRYVNYFFDVYPQTSEGQGSGVIIDNSGYIVTNYHVVGDADKVSVALSQEEGEYDASIIGVDPENDLAVLKVKNPPSHLTPISLGNSENLKIGQKVYAIGNPFGLDRTLTAGIISSLGRSIKTEEGTIIEGAIQTDASVNPGNSGGPLLDNSGTMIGINTMIISPSNGSVGLGFAIPINKVKELVPELIQYGYVKRGWIDATFLPVTPRIARAINSPVNEGLMIMKTVKGGEAEKAGLKGGDQQAVYGRRIIYIGGDIITEINDIKINDYSSIVQVLKDKKPGENVKITFYRNKRKIETNLKLIDKRNFVDD